MAHRFCLSVFLLKTRDTGSNLNKKVPIQYMYLLEWKRIAKRKYCYFCNEITHCVASWCLQVKIFPSTLVKKQGGLSRIFTVTLSCNKQHCSWLSFISCICVMSFVFFFRCTIRPRQSFWSHIWIQPYIDIITRIFLCFPKCYKIKAGRELKKWNSNLILEMAWFNCVLQVIW